MSLFSPVLELNHPEQRNQFINMKQTFHSQYRYRTTTPIRPTGTKKQSETRSPHEQGPLVPGAP